MKTLVYILTILLTPAICSCRSVQYVPVESVKIDSVYLSKVMRDSVYIKDSVLIVKDDTIKEYRYKYIYKYKDRTDTVYSEKVDSIRVPYPVEAQLTKWQKLKQRMGGFAIAAIIIIILIVVGRLIYKLKK